MAENKTIIYLDTNFFVYLFTKEPNEVQTILTHLEKYKVFTSCLTYDEFVWSIRKLFNKETSLKAAEFLLSLETIYFLDLTKTTLNKSIETMQKFHLKPRDALHLATMQIKTITTIVTDDSDFATIEGIKNISVSDFLNY